MIPIGLVCALPLEARTLVGGRRSPRELGDGRTLCVAGIGPARARRAADELVARGARALVSWGLAGGLDPELAAGDLLVPAIVVDRSGARFETDARWCRVLWASLALQGGRTLVESDHVVATRAEKRALFQSARAAAVDMESAAVAERAQAAGLPFVALRAVCDAAGVELPRGARLATDPDGRTRPLALFGSLLARPYEVAGLWSLLTGLNAARAALRAAARRLGPRLQIPEAP